MTVSKLIKYPQNSRYIIYNSITDFDINDLYPNYFITVIISLL